MAVPTYTRLADVVAAGSIVVTVPWATVANDDEGGAASGTATFTIAVPAGTLPGGIQNLCDTLDALSRGGNALAVVT